MLHKLTADYFGVPDTPEGTADIFVIHYAYFQPEAQKYPTQNNGVSFPSRSGQAVSFMSPDDRPPYQMLFVPDDFSQSYVVTHWTDPGDYLNTTNSPVGQALINSTQLLPPPDLKDIDAAYAASINDIVQINNKGEIHYLAGAIQKYNVNSDAKWQKLNYDYKVADQAVQKAQNDSAADSSSASAIASMTSASAASSAAASASQAAAAAAGNKSSATLGVQASAGLVLTALAAGLASLL